MAAACVLAGCDGPVAKVQDTANHVRIDVEHMYQANRAENDVREARIMADGAAIERQNDLLAGRQTQQDGTNYMLRRDPSGWSVVDLKTGQPVRTSGAGARGMALAKAQGMLNDLESAGDSRDAPSSQMLTPRR
jgi:hypothetical protein